MMSASVPFFILRLDRLADPDPAMTSLSRFFPIVLVFILAGCGAQAESPAGEPPPPPVHVAPVERGVHPLPIRASGRLAARAETPLAFKVGGVIQSILVDEGDRVRAGEPLARLDRTEINAQVREARSALEQARRNLQRTTRLYRDSVATLEEKQNAETAVEMAEARLEQAQFNRRYAVITAPESGPILERRAEEGELVGPNVPVLVLGATGRGWVMRAGLTDRDIVRIQRGDSARVMIDAHPNRRFAARVRQVADAADPRSSTYTVELDVDPAGAAFKSGFVAKADLYPSDADTLTLLPATALVEGEGMRGTVYTLDARADTARVRRTSVRIFRFLDDRLALPGDALPPDATVVTAGAARLEDGDRVAVVE